MWQAGEIPQIAFFAPFLEVKQVLFGCIQWHQMKIAKGLTLLLLLVHSTIEEEKGEEEGEEEEKEDLQPQLPPGEDCVTFFSDKADNICVSGWHR